MFGGVYRNKRVLVTGHTGFKGSWLCKWLNHLGAEVFGYSLNPSTEPNHFDLSNPKVNSHINNIQDLNSVKDFISKSEPEIIFHLAAQPLVIESYKEPLETFTTNVIGTANVLEAAKENNVTDRLIDFSTSEVFGSMAFKSSETDSTVAGSAGEARWTYAVSKLAGEHLAHAYYKQFNLPCVTVRPFNVYGPGQTGEGAIQIFIKKALKNETISIDGDGNQIRAWCYVDDFVDCIMECIENPVAIGESFNIGNARAVITILGLANTVCRVLNSSSKIIHEPPLSADIAIRIPSVEKIEQKLGIKAKVDLEEGIQKTADWMKNNLVI